MRKHTAAIVITRVSSLTLACGMAGLSLMPLGASAQAAGEVKGAVAIFTCTAGDGRKLTSDRPIAECSSREQRILNADGSLRGILPPFLSPEERAAKEIRDRKAAAERIAQQDAIRRDRNLMQRFPNAEIHQRARNEALDDTHKAMRLSERRIKELELERKPLLDEAEFYKGKTLPLKLKQQLDANDAGSDAQLQLIENNKAELVRINKRYDQELQRLKKLWAGAAPGTLSTTPGQ